MKRRLLFLANFLFSAALFSFSSGNPAAPCLLDQGIWISDTAWCHPQAGGEGDWLFNKSFSPKSGAANELGSATVYGSSQQGMVNATLFERFSAQGFLGKGQYTWKWEEDGEAQQARFQGGFLWRVDGKLVLFEAKSTVFGLDGQVGGWSGKEGTASARWTYWQAGGAITQKISFFAPYLGFAVNYTDAKMEKGGNSFSFESSRSLGILGGATFSFFQRVFLNVEWRQGFERGLSLIGQARF